MQMTVLFREDTKLQILLIALNENVNIFRMHSYFSKFNIIPYDWSTSTSEVTEYVNRLLGISRVEVVDAHC